METDRIVQFQQPFHSRDRFELCFPVIRTVLPEFWAIASNVMMEEHIFCRCVYVITVCEQSCAVQNLFSLEEIREVRIHRHVTYHVTWSKDHASRHKRHWIPHT